MNEERRNNGIGTRYFCINFVEANQMKTKVILESQNKYAKQENKKFEKAYMRAMLIALLEDKKISKSQYDECKRRMKIE